MAAGLYDFTIEQGATLSKLITWKDSAGVAVSLTGYTARLKAKVNKTSPTAVIDLNTENGGISLAAAGDITLTMSATATSALDFNKAYYDLELISGSGFVTRLLEGVIELSKEVTN